MRCLCCVAGLCKAVITAIPAQEVTKRLYVDVIIKAAMLITISACGLGERELRWELEVSLKGHTAAGDLDYLLILEKVCSSSS